MMVRSDKEAQKMGVDIVFLVGQHLGVVVEGFCRNWFWVLVFGGTLFEN